MGKTAHAGRSDPDLWEREVNGKWNGQQPILSPEESVIAARKLYRHAMGKSFTGKIEVTGGNRYTWVRRGVMYVNPDKREGHTRGLRSIIHDLSHWCHNRLHPSDSPHSKRQARLEARMVRFALDRRWHEGTLKKPEKEAAPEPPKPDKVKQRYERIDRRRMKYRKEYERLGRLLKKAERDARYYETRYADRIK